MTRTVKIIVGTLIAVIVGGGLGIGSAVAAGDIVANSLGIRNGPWQTSLVAGNQQADLYTRASVATHFLLALNRSEVLYYNAYTDDSGQPLEADCTYRIDGKSMETRWWSITAYNADDFLIPNDANRYSYNSGNVQYDANNNFVIYLSRSKQAGAWLPLGDQKTFSLTLRLYNPGKLILDNPAIVELPHITRVSCP